MRRRKKGRNITADDQDGLILHRRPGAPFFVQVSLSDKDPRGATGSELLMRAAAQLDSDDALIWLYVSHLLAPLEPLPAHYYAGNWIDLDDVARKTLGGLCPQSC